LALDKKMNLSKKKEETYNNNYLFNYYTFLRISKLCLEIDTGQTIDQCLILIQNCEQTPNNYIQNRTNIILHYLSKPPKNILEIGPSSDTTRNTLISNGYDVTYVKFDKRSNQEFTPDNYTNTLEHFENNDSAKSFHYCILQDMPPDHDYLDLFNKAWDSMADNGTMIVLQEFTLHHQERNSLFKSPLEKHFIRQANDCGFILSHEEDYSAQALNTLQHLQYALDKNKSYILNNSAISNEEYKLTTDITAYRVSEYLNKNISYKLISLSKAKRPRWTIHLASESDTSILQDLFFHAFDNRVSAKLWAWKYFNHRGMGILAKHQGRAIAHYGGILRKLSYFSNPVMGVQISDVMVSPRERSLLTKKGAFFKVAAAFPEYFVGYGSKALIGYGFPNMRHMRLAEIMGLYKKVGQIHELSWKTKNIKRLATVSDRPINPETDKRIINRLWSAMAMDLNDSIIGFRDWDYVNHRYLQHPENEYQIHLIYRRLVKKPLGIAVLHHISSSECRLIDLITPIKNIPIIISQALCVAKTCGCETLKAWGSEIVTSNIQPTKPETTVTDICIPTSIWTNGPEPETINGKWWLMYGDTDFN
jgi:hypothetical protein